MSGNMWGCLTSHMGEIFVEGDRAFDLSVAHH